MVYPTRIKYTEEMKSYIWDRYQQGDSVWSIARSFDRSSSSIHQQLSRSGGIRPVARKRSSRSLSLGEREEISPGLVAGLTVRTIASQLGRAPSTISREISRNGGCHAYRASRADQNAWDRALRQYLPKGTDLSVYSQAQLSRIARELNERPRKTLDYETPAAIFNACVALTS